MANKVGTMKVKYFLSNQFPNLHGLYDPYVDILFISYDKPMIQRILSTAHEFGHRELIMMDMTKGTIHGFYDLIMQAIEFPTTFAATIKQGMSMINAFIHQYDHFDKEWKEYNRKKR